MERLDLGNSNFPVRIFDQDIDLKKPSISQVFENEEKIKAVGDDSKKAASIMQQFIVDLGMPKDIAEKMSMEQFEKIMNHLNGSKKN